MTPIQRASALALALLLPGCDRSTPEPTADSVSASVLVSSPAEPEPSTAPSTIDAAIDELVEYAAQRRASLDFSTLAPWSTRSGADPFALLSHGPQTLGLLRSGRLVTLDPDAVVLYEATTLGDATALALMGDRIVVSSEATGALDVFDSATLDRRDTTQIPGVASIRDVAWGEPEQRLYLADPHRHRILRIPAPGSALAPADVEPVDDCRGAHQIVRTGPWLVYSCLLGHRVVVRVVDRKGRIGPAAAIEHDGPLWSFDAHRSDDGNLWVLAGGVEDRPLDRTDGSFGYIDSFAFVYTAQRVVADPTAPLQIRREHVLNVAEHGVITPKHVHWTRAPDSALVTGYGSDVALGITWPSAGAPAKIQRHEIVPGITDAVGALDHGLFADPLLDAWVVTRPDQPPRVVAAVDPTDDRTPSERLGEALVFTGLLAPRATSEGRQSRFTCETCHFEGRTDGRTHWTGRGQVHATTKTLRGLLANRPHFSRALDPTTAGMVHNEFRVANAGTGFDPWFSLTRADAPWLDALGAPADPLDPVVLRRALVDFLAAFTPEPNPAIRGLAALTPEQTEGAQLFARHCESCHRARLVADDPASAVPFEQWPQLVLHPSGGIVWGSEARARTGVEPYVHPEGPRAPSLRRLWVKRPLLTNGSADSVDAVLRDVRLQTAAVHGGEEGEPLAPEQQRALAAFLDLL